MNQDVTLNIQNLIKTWKLKNPCSYYMTSSFYYNFFLFLFASFSMPCLANDAFLGYHHYCASFSYHFRVSSFMIITIFNVHVHLVFAIIIKHCFLPEW